MLQAFQCPECGLHGLVYLVKQNCWKCAICEYEVTENESEPTGEGRPSDE